MALSTRPVRGWRVESVEGAETVGEFRLEIFPLALEEDVFFRHVAEYECHFGLVGGVLEDGARELVHWGDAGTTCDQSNVVVLVGFVGVLGNWSLHVEPLAGDHVVHVFGHGTVGVAFDDEIEVTDSICKSQSVTVQSDKQGCSTYLHR